jgi:hypothetical protein
MTLSEAIRLGAMWKPQKFGGPNHQLKDETHTCALAAAAEAVGQHMLSVYEPHWLWPWSTVIPKNRYVRPCPACGYAWLEGSTCAIAVIHVIAHLNDRHHWTREAIADWVETVEPREVQVSVDALEPSAMEVS